MLISKFTISSYPAGVTIFNKYDVSDKFFTILHGQINVCNVNKEGENPVLIATIGKGRSIGERGVIRNAPRSLTTVAKTKVHLLTLTAEWFTKLLANSMFYIMDKKL
jgi:CRP-like cAMP-binding protein